MPHVESSYEGDGDSLGANEVWTPWYNTDQPARSGDFECLSCIRQRHHDVCADDTVTGAECRIAGTTTVFSDSNVPVTAGLDELYYRCTSEGIVCRNKDQPDGRQCQDYEVRFKCGSDPISETTMYWWVGVLALVLVIIPITWAIGINIRKRIRARRNPQNEGDSSVSVISTGSFGEPPPTYDALFGNAVPGVVTQVCVESETTGSTPSGCDNEAFNESPDNSRDLARMDSGISEVGLVAAEGTSGGTVTNTQPAQGHSTGFRRFPGMHLPIFPVLQTRLGRPLSGPPPPTYNDAIKHMQKTKSVIVT